MSVFSSLKPCVVSNYIQRFGPYSGMTLICYIFEMKHLLVHLGNETYVILHAVTHASGVAYILQLMLSTDELKQGVGPVMILCVTDILKKMRMLDDKIIYALNTSIPTESFRGKVDATAACQDLHSQIKKGHSERENIIKNCILVTADSVKALKATKEENPNDFEVTKNLRAEQTKLRLLQTELSVEEVIQDKTSKVFVEKCRSYYKPNQL